MKQMQNGIAVALLTVPMLIQAGAGSQAAENLSACGGAPAPAACLSTAGIAPGFAVMNAPACGFPPDGRVSTRCIYLIPHALNSDPMLIIQDTADRGWMVTKVGDRGANPEGPCVFGPTGDEQPFAPKRFSQALSDVAIGSLFTGSNGVIRSSADGPEEGGRRFSELSPGRCLLKDQSSLDPHAVSAQILLMELGGAECLSAAKSLKSADLSKFFPEPATILAGALVLLPFGASTLRSIRRRLR